MYRTLDQGGIIVPGGIGHRAHQVHICPHPRLRFRGIREKPSEWNRFFADISKTFFGNNSKTTRSRIGFS